MKVYIGNYPSLLVCNIHSNHMNKKYGIVDWSDNQDYEDHVLEAIQDGVQKVYDALNWIWFSRRTQKVKVRIDKHDTWSMDCTLAPIILPMLKQLKETKHGAPIVDNVDVPEEFRAPEDWYEKHSTLGEVDPKHYERWNWVLDEMIWAFEQKCRDDWSEDYYGPWIENTDGKTFGGHFEWTNDKGRKAHQERVSNGFRLFGTYFENLWD